MLVDYIFELEPTILGILVVVFIVLLIGTSIRLTLTSMARSEHPVSPPYVVDPTLVAIIGIVLCLFVAHWSFALLALIGIPIGLWRRHVAERLAEHQKRPIPAEDILEYGRRRLASHQGTKQVRYEAMFDPASHVRLVEIISSSLWNNLSKTIKLHRLDRLDPYQVLILYAALLVWQSECMEQVLKREGVNVTGVWNSFWPSLVMLAGHEIEKARGDPSLPELILNRSMRMRSELRDALAMLPIDQLPDGSFLSAVIGLYSDESLQQDTLLETGLGDLLIETDDQTLDYILQALGEKTPYSIALSQVRTA